MEYKELDDSNPGVYTQESSTSLRETVEQYLRQWIWFVLGLLIAWGASYAYLRYAQRLYVAEAKVLIKADGSNTNSELSALTGKGFGRFDNQGNIGDQIEVMRSRRLVSKVVSNLQLNVRYFSEGRVKQQELFQEASPLKVTILSKDPSYLSFEVFPESKSDFKIVHNEKSMTSSYGKSIRLGDTEFTILPRSKNGMTGDKGVKVTIYPNEVATSIYKGKLSISPLKEGSVLSVSMVDNLPQRAKVIIDDLINQYNQDALNDKRIVGEKTTQFIEERLAKVSEDLQGKDRDVEVFKKGNNVIDLDAEGGISLSEASANHAQFLQQNTQLSLVGFVQDYLKTNKSDLIPVNIGLTDGGINSNAQKYNELILAKNDMLKHSTENSQIVQNINDQISEVGDNLAKSLNNYKKTIQITLNKTQGESGSINSKINAFPTMEKQFKHIARQQQIVEALYLFLLQKREENEITNAATSSAIKVVDYAYSSNSPIAPNKKMIQMAATAAGLLIPFGIMYLLFLMDNKVHGRKDVERLGISIIGEIPTTPNGETIIENDRSSLAESFRILRTNIGYYLTRKKKDSKAIFITSTIGGEGKTYIASNLGIILSAAKKHKVLVIGADIREPKILEILDVRQYKSHLGLTEFLSDDDLTLQDIVIHENRHEIDLIHSGAMAPNPAELLMNGRFAELMSQAREMYDYIVVDTAPMSLVADTQLIAKYSDMVIYIVRANYLDKRMLDVVQELSATKRLPNMALLLNDVGAGWKSNYGYGYGYGYGYTNNTYKKWHRWVPSFLRK